MERNVQIALDWVERITGGAIVENNKHERWRPQYFIDVKMPNGEIRPLVLRGWRTPGIVDDTEAASRERLRREAGILKALESTPVKSPRYYGYEESGDWILMERVVGEELLTEIKDDARQLDIFTQYLENMAELHKFDVNKLELPETLHRPRDMEHCATWSWKQRETIFRAERRPPNPIYELAFWWLNKNRPEPVSQLSLCTGDVGANQFFFENDKFKAIFDLEMAYLGDPLQDIGLMRYRNMCYPVSGFDKAVGRYFEVLGSSRDIKSLQYWTVVGLVGVSPTYQSKLDQPDASMAEDMSLLWAMQPRRRGLAEVFHQIYDFDLPEYPQRPQPDTHPYLKLNRFVVDEVRDYYRPRAHADDAFAFKHIQAHLEALQVTSEIGREISCRNIDDLAQVIGSVPADEESGLYALQRLIEDDPEKDLESRLNAIYRIEARAEFITAPIQEVVGFGIYRPLGHLSM